MGDLLSTILHELKQATGATKTLAGIVAATVLAMIGVAAVVSSHADFQPAFSELSAPEMSGVSKALADAGISFEVSQPPGPFVVFVDNGDRSAAMAAAYSSGALDKPIGGIISDTGAGSLFLGNEERRQAVRKREWQEAEGILETLDFVMSAKVTTSPGDPRPLLGRPAAPTTASVTLRLIGSQPMTSAQFGVVSRLVSRGLGVKPGDLIVSDQSGTFYDGAEENETDVQLGDRLAYQQDYNQRLAGEVDAALARALGPDMAYVMIQSEWDFDQSVTRSETAAKGAPLSEDTVTSSRPVIGSSGPGGIAGISSNVASGDGFGVDNAGVPESNASQEPQLETSNETRTQYAPSRTVTESVRSAPELKRLSIALFVDASVPAEQLEKLRSLVSAGVQFNEERNDTLTAEQLSFVRTEVPTEDIADPVAEEPVGAPSPIMEMLLTRGIEILCAVIFIFFLLKSLRSASKAAKAAVAPVMVKRVASDGTVKEVPLSQEPDIDPEMLARMQIEQLLDSDPDKVGEILSSWARGEEVETGAAA